MKITVRVVRVVSGFLDTNTYFLEEDGNSLIIDSADNKKPFIISQNGVKYNNRKI